LNTLFDTFIHLTKALKEIEHISLGWKVLWKNAWVSVKKCDAECLNLKTNIFKKDEKCMKTEVNPCSVPWTRKWLPLIFNGVMENVLCTIFFQNIHLGCVGYILFSICMHKMCSVIYLLFKEKRYNHFRISTEKLHVLNELSTCGRDITVLQGRCQGRFVCVSYEQTTWESLYTA